MKIKSLNLLLIILFLFSCSQSSKNYETALFSDGVISSNKSEIKSYESHSSQGMIVSEGKEATEIAQKILKRGGTAIDAAVALSFAISVLRPHSTGIGGGGFLLYYHKKENKTYVVDMREMAPAAAHSTFFMKKGKADPSMSREGGKSIAVPGLVAGLWESYQKLSPKKLKWKELVLPSAELAENGFPIYSGFSSAIQWAKEHGFYEKFPEFRKYFSNSIQSDEMKLNEHYQNKNLGKTLREISQNGKNGFYKGWVAEDIVNSVKNSGGVLTLNDLNNYQVKWRVPVVGKYKDYEVVSMPPPSSGGVHIIQILNILENFKMPEFASAQSVHLKAEAMKRAYADRAEYLGDSDFTRVPLQGLISKKYAQQIAQGISLTQASASLKDVKAGKPFQFEKTETTHFSIVDRFGNAVVSTQTINSHFGSGVVAGESGIVLNNEMDDFAISPGVPNIFGLVGGVSNQVLARKRPLSSMSPTFVFKKGKLIMGLGSPGGSQIMTTIFNVLFNVIEHKMSLQEAILAPRIHHQWLPDKIIIEKNSMPSSMISELENLGHVLSESEDYIGNVTAFQWDELKKEWVGVADQRREGLAQGL